jgi:plastocyanin
VNSNDLRERLLLPVMIPVGALAFVGFMALTMASILLRVPAKVATAVALMVAFNLLVSFAILALKPDLAKQTLFLLLGIAIFPVLLGAVAATGIVPIKGAKEEKKGEVSSVAISAENLSFNVKELKIPAGKAFEIAFNNKDSQPHNIEILEAQGSPNSLFKGDIVTGPKSVKYKVKSISAGHFYFQCDVHPTMNGTVVAEEGKEGAQGGEEKGEKSAAAAVDISAQNLSFNVKELKIPADKQFQITFDNKEPQQHNIEILEAQGSPKSFFKGEIVQGPKKQEYKVDPIPAGNYYFQCDVHPTMNGTVVAA